MARPPTLRGPIEKLLAELARATHPRELAARLDVPWDEQDDFYELLELLVADRVLIEVPGGRVELAPVKPTEAERKAIRRDDLGWDGKLSMHARGFGFVTALGKDDVFIPPDAVYEALHADIVHVVVSRKTERGLEGRVEHVVKRRSPRIAGVLRKKGKGVWMEPDDTRLRSPVMLPKPPVGAKDGDAVIAEITRFPAYAGELCEAEIASILGPEGDPKTEVKKILVREQVSEEHLPATLANAKEMAELLRVVSLKGRRDLRQVPLPTIDPEDARDHDDAVWVERNGKGYRAYVAIADVSEFVREDSALDEESKSRGCTIYLPDRAIPMLPKELAADQCSLLPHVERYCLCVIAELDQNAKVLSYELVEGVMKSAAKLTYGGVARALGFDPESPSAPDAEKMKADLEVLAELAFRLRKKRMDRGSLDLDLPEPRVHLDPETGAPTEVTKRATRPGLKKAYAMIEEMMLLANELVAEWLTKKKAPAIYRVHGKPDETKLEKLALVASRLSVDVDTSTLLEPKGVSEFLKSTKDHERHHVLELLLLRSLKQAQYDIDNVGHFGLASECYLHFTSPIRRYPDLCVHRQVKGILRGEKIDRSAAAIDTLREAAQLASTRERAAMEVEREVMDLYRALYMQRHIGDTFEGRITGVVGSGIYVALDDPFCDVMIRFEGLGPDRYDLSDDELSIVGSRSGDSVTLGDNIKLTIEDVALFRRTVYGKRVLTEEQIVAISAGNAGNRDGFARGPGFSRGPSSGGARRGAGSGGASSRDAGPRGAGSRDAGPRGPGASRGRLGDKERPLVRDVQPGDARATARARRGARTAAAAAGSAPGKVEGRGKTFRKSDDERAAAKSGGRPAKASTHTAAKSGGKVAKKAVAKKPHTAAATRPTGKTATTLRKKGGKPKR